MQAFLVVDNKSPAGKLSNIIGGHSAVCLLIGAITCIGVETQDMHGRLKGIPVAAK